MNSRLSNLETSLKDEPSNIDQNGKDDDKSIMEEFIQIATEVCRQKMKPSLSKQHEEKSHSLQTIIESEIEVYETEIGNANLHCDAFEFWNSRRLVMPNLFLVAKTLLTVPANSSPSETIFRRAGWISNRRHLIGDVRLENEILLKVNSEFVAFD